MFEKSPILRWRNYSSNYTLEGNKCIECNKIYYPKVYLCKCSSTDFEKTFLSGNGKLLAFTQVINPPSAFSKMAPYCIGLIELEQGPKIISQITDVNLQDLKIGMNLQATFRKFYTVGAKGIINYGLKFAPI